MLDLEPGLNEACDKDYNRCDSDYFCAEGDHDQAYDSDEVCLSLGYDCCRAKLGNIIF